MEWFKVVILLSELGAVLACPDNCQCLEVASSGPIVYCSPSSVEKLHEQLANLPANTYELHVGDHGEWQCNLNKQLVDNAFKDLPETVVNLYVEKCGIETINAGAFKGLTAVQDVFITDNPVTVLPDGFVNGMTALTGLAIRNCPLKEIAPTVFNEQPCFRRLEVVGTEITDLSSSLGKLKCLANLNVSDNKLTKVAGDLVKPTLIELDISYNMNIQLDSPVFRDMTSLTYLGLAGVTGDVSRLPDDLLSGLTNHLKQINIADNEFKDMAEIEQFLKDVLHVEYLDASGNQIRAMKREYLDQLKDLKELRLSRNYISELESYWLKGPTVMTILKLDHNWIYEIPSDAFFGGKHIEKLDLSYNRMTNVEDGGFNDLEVVTSLDLAGNRLNKISQSMLPANLATVTTLDLSNSSINSIDDNAFDNLANLETLNLDYNELSQISRSLLGSLASQNIHVDISHNDWDCNCAMFMFRQWMVEDKLNFSMICARPEGLAGKDVMEMDQKETFGCAEPSLKECCEVNRTVIEGGSVEFTCTVQEGDPKPNITIATVDGDPLPANRTDYTQDKSIIVVRDVKLEDEGNFTCTAANIWGNVTTVYHLYVDPIPTTTAEPNTTTEANTTTPLYTTTFEPGNLTTDFLTTTAFPVTTASPGGGGGHGAVIGITVFVILAILACAVVAIAWYVKKRRADDTRPLVADPQSPQVQV